MKSKNKQIYVIEHLEPKLWPWCLIEYKNISKIVGKENLWFTNIKEDSEKLKEYGKVFAESVSKLTLINPCILDPEAEKTLKPEECKKFDYFIFGGILGDNPPRKRTKNELTLLLKNTESRNIGKEQFSTDNAVFVVHEICSGKNLSDIKFQNAIEIEIDEIESIILPYKYALSNSKPVISPELIAYLKKKEFEFN